MSTWEERFSRQTAPEPRLELLETAWRYVAPSNRILECGIYRTDAGLEVRVAYSDRELVHSQWAFALEAARDIAAELRNAVVAKGGFTELTT